MIPEVWAEEHASLVMLQHAQSQRSYVWSPDEIPVGDSHFAALDAKPVTPNELVELATGVRGQYRSGDTRGFVIAQEQACVAYNCWMARAADGAPRYLSEPVVV